MDTRYNKRYLPLVFHNIRCFFAYRKFFNTFLLIYFNLKRTFMTGYVDVNSYLIIKNLFL